MSQKAAPRGLDRKGFEKWLGPSINLRLKEGDFALSQHVGQLWSDYVAGRPVVIPTTDSGAITPGDVMEWIGRRQQQGFLGTFNRSATGAASATSVPGGGGGQSAPSGQQAAAQAAQPAAQSDAAGQTAANQNNLTSGPFAGSSQQASLFGLSGSTLDPTTQLHDVSPGQVSRAAQAEGRYGTGEKTVPMTGITTVRSAEEWMSNLYRLSPGQLTKLQHQLFDKGWFPDAISDVTKIKFGRVDDGTLAAYQRALLDTARQNGAGDDSTITDTIAKGGPNIPGAKNKNKHHPPVVALENPADINESFVNTTQPMTGGGMSAGEQSAETVAYQAQQAAAYSRQAAVDAQDPTTGLVAGGPYVAAPTADAFARDYALQHNQADIKAYQTAVNALHFADMLKGL